MQPLSMHLFSSTVVNLNNNALWNTFILWDYYLFTNTYRSQLFSFLFIVVAEMNSSFFIRFRNIIQLLKKVLFLGLSSTIMYPCQQSWEVKDRERPLLYEFTTNSTLPLLCWCHQYIPAEDVKGQQFVHEKWNRQNIDYQRTIRVQRSGQSSFVWNSSRLREAVEIPHWREQDEKIWIYVSVTKTVKKKEDRFIQLRPTDCETMDILDTHAYDRRQRRYTVPTNNLLPFTAPTFCMWNG